MAQDDLSGSGFHGSHNRESKGTLVFPGKRNVCLSDTKNGEARSTPL